MKITAEVVWAKLSQVSTLDSAYQLFVKEALGILSTLEVNKVKRIGWRNYFVYEFSNSQEEKKVFEKIIGVKDAKVVQLQMEIKTGKDFEANLIIQPVVKNDDEKTKAILFNVDLFQIQETSPEDITRVLKSFSEYLRDNNGFLAIVNKILE